MWYIIFMALVLAAGAYQVSTGYEQLIAVLGSLLAVLLPPYLLYLWVQKKYLREAAQPTKEVFRPPEAAKKSKRYRLKFLAPILGLFLALVVFGSIQTFLLDFPKYVSWIVLGFLASLSTYGFELYERLHELEEVKPLSGIPPKILDSSVVIDGRLKEIMDTGFIDGKLLIPNFVLREIQLVADSDDSLKRERGRRGLDVLKELQERKLLTVTYQDYIDTREVDTKLVRLAKEVRGKLLTTDFNLNQVAKLQNVPVLNINELANAVRPPFIPGEELDLELVKEGKEFNQAVGYLTDGTMFVVENARKLIGRTVKVQVTSILQTNAGKMIFAKLSAR